MVSELKCKDNSIWNYTTIYTCQNRGSDISKCLGKQKSKVVIQCEIWENCQYGTCVATYNNECDYLCTEGGFDLYYCTDLGCGMGDKMMNTKGDCSSWGRTCCCHNEGDETVSD
jgi:hypothetical protein